MKKLLTVIFFTIGLIAPSVYSQANPNTGRLVPGVQNITPVNYAVDTGAANAYAVAPSPVASSYVVGLIVNFKAIHSNTGASTINVNSLGVKNITKLGTTVLGSADIVAGGFYSVAYDGAEFQLLNPATSSGGSFTPGIQNITVVDYSGDSGTANAYAVTPSPVATSYVAGLTIAFTAANTNTGASTINVNSLGVKNLDKLGIIALFSGDIIAGAFYIAEYDGTEFQLMNPTVGATPAVVSSIISGTSDTINPVFGLDLGKTHQYTSSSSVAVAVTGATFNGQYFGVDVQGSGAITLTPSSGQIKTTGGTLASTLIIPGASVGVGFSCYIKSYDGTNYNADCHPSSISSSIKYRICDIPINDTSGSAITSAQMGPQSRICFIPSSSTIVEMDVNADAGTPNIIVGRNHAGTITNIVSSALATAASGGIACSNIGGTTGLNGATTCSATLQNTSIVAGDYLELVSGTPGGTAKFFVVHIVMVVN